ncbi:amino acid adenylation domain-containing protein [Hymenobacter aquaticus]|uniref:Amino acid adenylation domain-containing protein n=1 Tax=Hymenobacter aquaticus TaxID=1867101 RepID=A0A4Z0PW10_9BACT|nr:non-ribosomal peptide synthetase [Hymenobacter aquaticus]TGE21484.1 amino acid adenylation domain-containing protein [Hymenobacter aquaticus]
MLSPISKNQEFYLQFTRNQDSARLEAECVLQYAVDRKTVAAAIQTVVARYDILRTVFVSKEGLSLPMQSIGEVGEQAGEMSEESEVTLARPLALHLEAAGPEAWRLKLRCLPMLLDIASIKLFFAEVAAVLAGTADALPAADDLIQTGQYAAWQEELATEENEEAAAFWKQASRPGEDGDLRLPFQQNPNGRPFVAAVKTAVVAAGALKSAAQRYGVDVQTLVVALYAKALQRFTERTAFALDFVTNGRAYEELASVIGPFSKNLPLQLELTDTADLAAFSARLQENIETSLDWSDYYFADRYAGIRAPNTRYVVEYHDVAPAAGASVLTNVVALTSAFSQKLLVLDNGATLDVQFQYDQNQYDATAAELLLANVAALLAEPTRSATALLPQDREIVAAANATAQAPTAEHTVLQLIEQAIAATPEATALVGPEESFSYQEMGAISKQLAGALKANYGVGAGDLIGLAFDLSTEIPLAMLGVLYAGAAYIPIDSNNPKERIQKILLDSRCKLILTQEELVEEWQQEFPGFSILTVAEVLASANEEAHIELPLPAAADTAYIIYTSGTTGEPKGCVITHANLLNYISWVNGYYFQAEPATGNFSLITNFSFDLTVTALFSAISRGKSLQCFERGLGISEMLYQSFEPGSGVDTVKMTPTHISLLAYLGLETTNVRHVIVGGEALLASHIRILRTLSPDIHIYNEYGPTEATVGCIVKEIGSVHDTVLIGLPITNMEAYVLTAELELAPVGSIGELYLAGQGLAKGYLNKPDMTSAKFVEVAALPGKRLYKSGDLARFLPSGEIDYLGRIDDQVKIRGYRVELQEIQKALDQHQAVNTSMVTLWKNASEESYLVAYYISSETLETAVLREFVADKVPEYMVPAVFIPVDAIPLTANGKLDVKKLPNPQDYFSKAAEYVPAGTEMEHRLVALWEEVLGTQPIGVHDDFFEIGGHSLKVTQLISRYHRDFEIMLSLQDFYTNTTIAGQAELIGRAAKFTFVNIEKTAEKDSYPASNGQKRLWVMSQVGDSSSAFNIFNAMQFEGEFYPENFEQALITVLNRHESLRTVFGQDPVTEEVRQFIRTTAELNFKVDYLDLTAAANQREQVLAVLEAEAKRVFDLGAGPLLRVGVIKTADARYVVYYNAHHIICDGWSMEVFISNTMNCYGAYLNAQENPLPPLAIQYRDYAAWLDKKMSGDSFQESRSYWLDKFSGELPVLNLPSDKKRPLVKTYNGASLRTKLDKEAVRRLRQFSQERGGTLLTGLLAVVKGVLHRYTGQEDIIIGSPIAGREHADLEEQIGFYVNTLALRTQLSADDSFEALFERVKATTLGAFQHQLYPFDQLVEELGLKRDTSRLPLFDCWLLLHQANTSYQNNGWDFGDLSIDAFPFEGEICKYDYLFSFAEFDDELVLTLKYNTDIYSEFFATQLQGNISQFLIAAVSNPAEQISQIAYLTEAETSALEMASQGAELTIENEGSLLTEFTSVVSRFGSRVAVSGFGGEQLSYAELDALSSQLAHFLLAEAGAQPLSLVALALPQSPAVVVALLASWKAGAAYLPLDSSLPAARQQYMLRHSQAQLTLTAELYAEFLTQAARYPTTAPERPVAAADPTAYVIYTSGSTGQPKGVAVGHGSLRNYCQWLAAEAQLTEADTAALLTSYSFDLGYTVLFPTLLTGGQLCLSAPEAVLEDAAATVAWLEARQVSFLKLTPSLVQGLVLSQGVQALAQVGRLRLLVCGGATMAGADMAALLASNPQLTIFNHYGPTETTIGVCFQRLTQDSIQGFVAQPVLGGPIANVELLVADARQQPVPVGVVGELLIGGRSLAQGYLHEAGLTASKFVAHPGKVGAQVYRSGDQVVRQADGRLRFVGRVDEQVKVRGYRVEPGEVQHALLQLPGLAQAAVIALKQAEGDAALVAYVVPTTGQEIDEAALRTGLLAQLPAYMVPSQFVQLAALPVTANGKLDRAALPDPGQQGRRGAHYQAPQGAVETALATVWASVLRRENISRQDNFYDLGGDSIKSILVVSRLRQQGYSVEVADILGYPVLAELAQRATKLTRQISQATATGSVELSPIQHWFLDNEQVDKQQYNQSILLTSQERLNEENLRQSLNKLLAHHDGLRLRFTQDANGSWQQEYAPITESVLAVYDITQLPAAEARAEQLRLSEQLQGSFELAAGPLFQAAVFRQPDGPDELLLVAHHLVVDGVSWRILLEDLSTLYAQAQQGQPLVLPAKTDSLQAWQAQQQQQALSPALQAELSYWQQQDQAPVHALPLDQPAGSNQVVDAQVQAFVLPAELTGQLLTQTHRALGTEVQELLLTGLTQALQAQWPLGPVRLTLEGHGREWLGRELDVTRTVGWFTSKYPLVLDVRPAADSVEALIEVKEAVRRLPGKGIGYGLLRYLHPAQPLAGAPSSDIVFNYLGDFGAGAGNADAQQAGLFSFSAQERGASVSSRRERSSVLEVSALIVEGQLRVSVSYSQQQYQPATIAQLLAHYEQHLTELIGTVAALEQRQLTPSDLTFAGLSRGELAQLTAQVGGVQDVYGLTPLQEGMYYHWVQDAGSRAHGIQVAYRLEGQLQVALLEQSYQQLVSSYDVLRTSFTHHYGGRALQVVQPRVSGGFHFVDLSHLLGEALTEAVAAEKEADLAQGFDLSRGSQMRLRVLQLSENQYELIWSHHHIIMDAWCSQLLIQQFTQLYQGLVSGQPVQLLERHKYADYLRWLDQRDAQASLDYWAQYLQGYEQTASLPTQVTSQEYTQQEAFFQIADADFAGLQQLSERLGVTLSTVVQSAWGVLLGRYAGTQDAVFGTVVSGRPGNLIGVEEMVGLFINTIPVRVQYGNDTTVKELVQQVQQLHIASEPHHYRQLAEVQAQSALGRNLLDHILVFQNTNAAESAEYAPTSDTPGLDIISKESYVQTNFDFNFVLYPSATQLAYRFRFNAAKYDPAFIERLGTHFQQILRAFVAQANQPVRTANHLPAAEQQQLLAQFDATGTLPRTEETVLSRFEKQVAATPAHTAVVAAGEALSYQALNERVNQLANYFRGQGITEGAKVAFCLNRPLDALTSLLATLKAGGVYVPLDTQFPEARKAFMLSDSQAALLVVDAANAAAFDQQSLPLLVLDAPDATWQQEAVSAPATTLRPADVAYLIYTSGSTGQPKGVMVTHRNLVDYLDGLQAKTGIVAGESFGLLSTLAADLGNTVLFGALLTGGTLHLFAKEALTDSEGLLNYFEANSIGTIKIVPSHWKALQTNRTLLPTKRIIFGGEELTTDVLDRIRKTGPTLEVYNHYGPTETTIGKLMHRVDMARTYSRVPIGEPFSNTKVYVVDQHQNLCAYGVPGELLIGGEGVAAGYFGRPDLTAERFIADPFGGEGLVYRTGDLVTWSAEGSITFLGRIDQQLKIRGYRIELGEIENVLKAKDGIREAVVVAFETVPGEKELVGYFVSNAETDPATLRSYLLERLPEFMVPQTFVQLQEIPLTPNGKINRQALPNPQTFAGQRSQEFVAARTETEERLTKIWQKILGKETVGVTDNFFTSGGHSLNGILMLTKVHQQFNVRIDVLTLFETPTIEALAEEIENALWAKAEAVHNEAAEEVTI